MRRPLAALALAASFCAFCAAEPPQDSQVPENLREKVCTDGAYLRGKDGAKPAKKKAHHEKKKKDEGGGESPITDDGDFSPAGGDDAGIVKYQPKGDCSGFEKLFKPGKDGKSRADGLEIAPAVVDGKPVSPEEASKRFVSLSGLSRLKTSDPAMVARFFDGTVTSGDRDFLGRLGSGTAEQASALLGADNAVRADQPLGQREKLSLSEHKPVKIEGSVPGLNPAAAKIRPLQGPAPTPPPAYAPYEPGRFRSFYNNAKAEVIDYARGSPIADAEGERAVLPNPTPVIEPAGSDQSVNVLLPSAPGISKHCEPGCYGTRKMIDVLVGMGKDYDAYYSSQRTMSVGGISKLGGGYFPPHVSHQHGIDSDVSFARGERGFDALANAMIVAAVIRQLPDFHHINGREYILVDQSKHAAVGWGLDELVKQGNLTPEQAARGKSVLVHWPNHNDHFHIRILP